MTFRKYSVLKKLEIIAEAKATSILNASAKFKVDRKSIRL
jgi:hypothetical protein